MSLTEHFQRLEQAFGTLLTDLSLTWPKSEIEYVREEIGHREYGDALENLIAMGRSNERGFTHGQARQVASLAAAMELRLPPDTEVMLGNSDEPERSTEHPSHRL